MRTDVLRENFGLRSDIFRIFGACFQVFARWVRCKNGYGSWVAGAPMYGTDVIRSRREPSSTVIRTSSAPLHGIVSLHSLHRDGDLSRI